MSTITLNGSTTGCIRTAQGNLLRPRTPSCLWRCCQAFTCCWRKRKGDKRMVERTTSIYSSQTGSQTQYKTRKYYTSGIDHQWQADLVDMQQEGVQNEGFKYILTVIDLFSRYAWAEALRTKSPLHVKPAFEAIFSKGRKPMKLQTDQGTEFEAKSMQEFFKAHNIHHFSVKSQFKAAVVERFNHTLKEKMWRYFTNNATHKWVDVLQKLVTAYNKSHHRGIDMAPTAV